MSGNLNDFEQHLHSLSLAAEELPVSIIVHRIDTMAIVYMNKIGLETLGTTLDELKKIDTQHYHEKHFNSANSGQYILKIMDLIHANSNDRVSFFQEVRVPTEEGWQLYVSNTKIFHRNEDEIPTHIITVASRLDPNHHISSKVNKLVEDVGFFRENTALFLTLTKREREILRCMALGMASPQIAEKLFISSTTVDTHRRNIRNKLGLKNNYDAVKFAQAYDLV
jgi:DNA-binding CsgD family transcriptional regulator